MVHGRVKLFKTSEAGRETIVDLCGPGKPPTRSPKFSDGRKYRERLDISHEHIPQRWRWVGGIARVLGNGARYSAADILDYLTERAVPVPAAS